MNSIVWCNHYFLWKFIFGLEKACIAIIRMDSILMMLDIPGCALIKHGVLMANALPIRH